MQAEPIANGWREQIDCGMISPKMTIDSVEIKNPVKPCGVGEGAMSPTQTVALVDLKSTHHPYAQAYTRAVHDLALFEPVILLPHSPATTHPRLGNCACSRERASTDVKSAMRMERRQLTATFPNKSVHSSRFPRLRNGMIFCAYFASLRSCADACRTARTLHYGTTGSKGETTRERDFLRREGAR